MRFLLDECLSTRLVALLNNTGHDAVHVADLGLLGAPDKDVMRAATVESRVLVSADTDFGELLAAGRALGPSFVLFRRARRIAEEQIAVLLANLPDIEGDLDAGAVVVLAEDRIRCADCRCAESRRPRRWCLDRGLSSLHPPGVVGVVGVEALVLLPVGADVRVLDSWPRGGLGDGSRPTLIRYGSWLLPSIMMSTRRVQPTGVPQSLRRGNTDPQTANLTLCRRW